MLKLSSTLKPLKERIGWREWVTLSDLGITKIKAKIDTGARTSALHAFETHLFSKQNKSWIRFKIHPLQRNESQVIICEAAIIDQRWVIDSGGHKEKRYVIKTSLTLNNQTWPIEMTLTNRDSMGFRMLLGRTAMRGRLIVDPSRSYLTKSKFSSKP